MPSPQGLFTRHEGESSMDFHNRYQANLRTFIPADVDRTKPCHFFHEGLLYVMSPPNLGPSVDSEEVAKYKQRRAERAKKRDEERWAKFRPSPEEEEKRRLKMEADAKETKEWARRFYEKLDRYTAK